MSVSRQEKITIIINHKNQIVNLANNILQMVNDVNNPGLSSISERKLLLKQQLNQTVSELSIIAGFCGPKERKWVSTVSDRISMLSPVLEWCLPSLIESYCIIISGLIIDFNKTPFSFFNDDLKGKWREFEYKAKAVRKGKW